MLYPSHIPLITPSFLAFPSCDLQRYSLVVGFAVMVLADIVEAFQHASQIGFVFHVNLDAGVLLLHDGQHLRRADVTDLRVNK